MNSKKIQPKLLIGVVVVAVIVVAVLVIKMNKKTEVDIAGYYDFTFEGISPYGSASVQVDYEGFTKKYGEVFYADAENRESKMEDALEDADDIFELIDEYDDDDPVFDNIDYTLEDSDGEDVIGKKTLANGDTLTLKISIDSQEEIEKEYKCKFTNLEKEFTVDGLGEYITESKAISDENLDKLESEADTVINDNFNHDGFLYSTSLKDKTYMGMLVGTKKDADDDSGSKNVVYLIYKLDVSYDKGRFDDTRFEGDTTVYYYVAFQDVYTDTDDKFVYSDPYTTDDTIAIEDEAELGWDVEIDGYESYSKLKEAIDGEKGTDFEFDEDVDDTK